MMYEYVRPVCARRTVGLSAGRADRGLVEPFADGEIGLQHRPDGGAGVCVVKTRQPSFRQPLLSTSATAYTAQKCPSNRTCSRWYNYSRQANTALLI